MSCIIHIYDDKYYIKSHCDTLKDDITNLKEKLAKNEKINLEKLEKIKQVETKIKSLNTNSKVEKVENRYIPKVIGYEYPWESINIKNCKACRRSKKVFVILIYTFQVQQLNNF